MNRYKLTVFEVVKGANGAKDTERERGVTALDARTVEEAKRAARGHVERSGWKLRALSNSSPTEFVAYVEMPVTATPRKAEQPIKRAFGTPRS